MGAVSYSSIVKIHQDPRQDPPRSASRSTKIHFKIHQDPQRPTSRSTKIHVKIHQDPPRSISRSTKINVKIHQDPRQDPPRSTKINIKIHQDPSRWSARNSKPLDFKGFLSFQCSFDVVVLARFRVRSPASSKGQREDAAFAFDDDALLEGSLQADPVFASKRFK